MNCESWKLRRIDSLGRIITGKTPSSKNPEYFDGPFPFITIPDMENKMFMEETRRSISKAGSEKISTHVIPKNSVCISCIATIGRVGLTTKSSITNQQINSIICNEDVDPVFLYYAMCNFSRDLKFFAGGGAVLPNISKSLFGKMEIFLPPLAEQKSISEKLFLLDRLIDNKKKISEIHEELIQTIFHSWFVNFDPLKAKLEGKSPKGMDEDTARQFSDSFEDSRLGPIPAGWRVGSMSDLCEKNMKMKDGPFGSNLKQSDFTETGVRLIHQENIQPFSFVTNICKYTSTEKADELSSHIALPGDIVLTKMPDPICRATIVPEIENRFVILADVIRIRPDKSIPAIFLLFMINSPLFRKQAELWSTGGTRARITLGVFRKLPCLIPPAELMQKFHDSSLAIFTEMEAIKFQIDTLERTRDVLITNLFSGGKNKLR